MEDNQSTQNNQSESSTAKVLRAAIVVGFIIAAALTAILTYKVVQNLVTSWEITSLPGVTIRDVTATPNEEGVIVDSNTPLQSSSGPTPPAWDGAQRVTLLLMGLDYRDWVSGEGPPRTDTMILFTLDPINRTAGILSIPRDLWVNIPGGYNYGRINTAYQLGEAYQLPGGGPDNTKTLKPGIQTLNGELALAYARARKTDGADFDRAERQQQVIMGIRNQILRFDMLTTLIGKAGILYNELSSGVRTNLNLDQAVKLAWLASQIPEENIKRGIIGPPDQVTLAVSPDGTQQVLKPITENIRMLRDEIFTESGPTSPMGGDMSPEEQIQAEGARVAVLNGSYTAGLAARTTEYLNSLGLNVIVTDNAQSVSTYTEIIFYNGKPYTVSYLVDLMAISPFRIRYFNDPTSEVDITLILGDDWASNNPMP
jgi:hypothetical protein